MLDPNVEDAQPLIVVGVPRSGTRFVANTLNQHPDVHINGEIPQDLMDLVIRNLNDIEAFYTNPAHTKRRRWARGWSDRKYTILYTMWGTLPKTPSPKPQRPIKWYGYKTPHHERYWRSYREVLPPDRQPRYVFCIRNFIDHYISAKTMADQGIAKRAKKYRESINTYAEMKAALQDDVTLFVLDDLTEGGMDYVRHALFDSLSIPVDADTLQALVPEQRVNDAASKGHVKKPLTKEERAFLDRNADLLDGLDAVRAGKHIAAENY